MQDNPEALPERGSAGMAIPEARGLSSLDVAVGVTSDGRGTTRETGLAMVAEVTDTRVTVDDPVLRTVVLLGVLSAASLSSCAFLAASAAHFCMFCASIS